MEDDSHKNQRHKKFYILETLPSLPYPQLPPHLYSQAKCPQSVLLGHAAHDQQLTGAEESVLTWDQQDNTEGALSAELPSNDLPLNIPL